MSDRHREIAVELIYVLDRYNPTWEDEYEVALGLLQSAFSRVPKEAQRFIMEKFLTRDLEEVSFFQITANPPTPVTAAN
jgi:hypothetical protein